MDKIISERGVRLECIELQSAEGKEYHIVLLVKESDYSKYQEALKNRSMVDLEKYGFVLLRAEGRANKELLSDLAEQYLNKK